jgi:hypothetical protein
MPRWTHSTWINSHNMAIITAAEALELVQACGMTKLEALGAVTYVYGRPVGEKR